MEPKYIKTGEDNKYEYYRNDSEVLSDNGEEEIYEAILNTKDKFNVKINNKEIIIKKRTVNRIMILSDSQPEEQILFSHYKTVEHNKSNDKIKTQVLLNENLNPKNQNEQPHSKPYKKINEPLSDNNINKNSIVSDNNTNKNTVVINIPSYNNNYDDNDNIMFKRTENADNLLLVGLPTQAVKAKWFYLLLVLSGLINIIYFIYCVAEIKFLVNIFVIMLFGLFQIFTGFLGFNKINKRIYNDKMLYIFTIICSILPIINVILILVSDKTNDHIAFGIIVNIFAIIFSVLCIVFTNQLNKKGVLTRSNQMEQLL